MQFDKLLSDSYFVGFRDSRKKINAAGRLKINLGQFRQLSAYSAEFGLLGDLGMYLLDAMKTLFTRFIVVY